MREPGARFKLRKYFLEHIGEVLESDALHEVAGTSEWARRVRELRNEEGYQILTHNDRSNLKPGQYILLDPTPKHAFTRELSKEVRAYVLDRNGFTCQMCGAVAGEPHPYDPTRKTRLHIGHIIDKSMGGTDDPSNSLFYHGVEDINISHEKGRPISSMGERNRHFLSGKPTSA